MEKVTKQALEALGLSTTVDLSQYTTLLDIYAHAVDNYGDKKAFTCLGYSLRFKRLHTLAVQFASYLQHHTTLVAGDRVAVQLPNILQYPVITYGILLADMVIVNVNPQYTDRELRHQLNDCGAKMLIVLANIAKTAEHIIADTQVEQVVITQLADLHPAPQRWLINAVVKYVKHLVPAVKLEAIGFRKALSLGAKQVTNKIVTSRDHLALLQYTGGTTGGAKGAMLSHGNVVANVLQCKSLFKSYRLIPTAEIVVVPLPLYHIYSFTITMAMLEEGNECVLIPDPRDLKSIVAAVKNHGMTFFCGINTLFVALCHFKPFKELDFSCLKLTLSGGMALTENAADQWQAVTGCEVYQGYGLTETSPVISCNPGGGNKVNSIGLPLPLTEIVLLDHQNQPVAVGERGELCMRGPQLMQGYWQQPEETANVIDAQGWFHTGDIAILDPDGYHRIVDRKKDMILVSGFNVYPNELDAVLSQHPGVLECAAIGVPDEVTGEAIKMFVVLKDSSVTQRQLRDFCRQQLTGYKVPKYFEIRDSLPKSAVGKILRRELRENTV